ncbi:MULTISPECIES: hypothetical protein [Niastella]|uniref:PA14 domain-containing protein n=1 Tax=Niastella soli TaxID=2821487 RepID=A0ABS3Z1S4_9BACT|nr:hypothetical protein [Niastella soli]MBO9203998.1 hypothetical protein [Niastella soli]
MRNRTKKCTAWFFLIVFGIETFFPGMAYALTSGPAQPELTKFEPAGVNDMVDLFSGDLKYNIPLVDVGGYPINLSYHSGEGMEDEASWVGFGWTVNPGTINRSVRGLPDDFKGDNIEKTYDRKNFQKIGGTVILKPSIFAWEIGKLSGSLTFKVGVYNDNYYGAGALTGLSVNQDLAQNKKTSLTAGLDIGLDSRGGATFSPSLSLSREHDFIQGETVRSLSGSLAYNTRAGLKQVDLGATWSTHTGSLAWSTFNFSAVKYFGQTYTPTFNTNTANDGYTLNFDLGPSLFGGYLGIGGSGYFYEERILQKKVSAPAYGYMNYLDGRKNTNALVDYNRENEGPYVPGSPAIPIPVPTFDLFMATGQAGSQQFRPFFNGNYVVFDKMHSNRTVNASAGVTIGVGLYHKNGGRIDYTGGNASTGKWVTNNNFLQEGEPEFDQVNKPGTEAVNFKSTGEITRADKGYRDNIQEEKTVQVVTNGAGHFFTGPKTWNAFKVKDEPEVSTANKPLKKSDRDRRTTVISYLDADQASKYGLDKQINGVGRMTDGRLPHHLSEITVTDNGGQRMVYGIPVYNKTQVDASFSIDKPDGAKLERALKTGLIEYTAGVDNSTGNQKGRDNLFTRDVVPGYATSFLLTGILSPDYVDVKDDGITDDDLGTAYKFNYTKTTDPSKPFKWRAPYAINTANYNPGFESDKKDDKASYTYGEKELWYLNKVESKTMIAVFVTSDREDGLGVQNENGGINGDVRLKKLDRIELYSKADWVKDETLDKRNVIPVKVVHFEYDYSTHPNVPNNTGAAKNKDGGTDVGQNGELNVNKDKGKLTLKKVYFTFGKNTRGQSNPYEFSYEQRKVSDVFGSTFLTPPATYQDPVNVTLNNPEISNSYTTRQVDRWGTYKPSWYNHLTGNSATNGQMNNSEFPYTIQENNQGNSGTDYRKLAGHFASMWQLNKIVTPTGSTISVTYEADDYGFVQNRRAMQMCFVKGIASIANNNTTNSTGMIGSDGFTVELPKDVQQADFNSKYLGGEDGQPLKNIYYKIYTDLDNTGHKEYVQGYAEIDYPACRWIDDKTAFIAVKKIDQVNPVTRAAWQMLKADLPQFAYDNYDNSDVSFGKGAIKALVQSLVNAKEFFRGYENRAKHRSYGDRIELSKSMIRLYNPDQKKMGGGARVKKLTIEDAWHDMSHSSGKTAMYGQEYNYAIKKTNGEEISSGVAAYEPQIGNEENPLHQPIPYTEKVNWAPDKYHFTELPFCETFFPPASVGYSKVTVTNFGDTYAQQGGLLEKHTGYIENEFYTAKDFPTYVDYMPLQATEYENNMLLKLFAFTYIKRVTTSQGFKIELNDMHGKPKSVKIFNKGGDEISSTETFYNVDDDKAAEKHLNNTVDIVEGNTGGKIETAVMGTDIDLATDVRESENGTLGAGIGAYYGAMPFFPPFIPYLPYAAVNYSANYSRTTYHSVSLVKVVQKYGIVKMVRTTKNGSSIEAENLLWDGETGAVLLTRTQNEFNDNIYSFTYPAYWAEGQEGMGGAYKNSGALLLNVAMQSPNIIPDQYKNVVFPGDELISTAHKGWVIQTNDGQLRFIDRAGNPLLGSGNYVVARSGRRNQTSVSAGNIVCLNNPVIGSGDNRRLQFTVGNKVLDAKAVLYGNEWGMPVANKLETVTTCKRFNGYNSNNTNTKLEYHNRCDDFSAYLVINQPPPTPVIINRSSINFLSLTDIPAGATIVSAKVKLYPKTTSGAATSLISRIKTPFYCGMPGLTWEGPQISTANQVQLPAFPFVTAPYEFDVTAMLNDWYTLQDNPQFGIGIRLVDESPTSDKFAQFRGPFTGQGPSLEICYQYNGCFDPVNKNINPYVQGLLGNWRPRQNFSFVVDREQKPGVSTQPDGTNIRKNGAYVTFNPFWEFRPLGGLYSNVQPERSLTAERWVWAAKSVYYDQKGNEIESVTPLNRDRNGEIDVSNNGLRYSSALFGYRESAAIAVAANARHNEIAFDGFEDYNFSLQTVNPVESCPMKRHFDWGDISLTNTNSGNCLNTQFVHSGKYSMKLNSVLVSKPAGNAAPPATILSYDNALGAAKLASNELATGFSPIAGKKYLLSLWVYDNKPATNKIDGLSVKINNQAQDLTNTIVPVVEKWKRLELVFTAGTNFNLQLSKSGAGEVYIDDVRILPYDGHLNSYVYDDRTMRLMGQLDENNFATFYEYDDEGTLIRVKKETERGIMTLKENRQSFRQR